jgi:hypothetical protein
MRCSLASDLVLLLLPCMPAVLPALHNVSVCHVDLRRNLASCLFHVCTSAGVNRALGVSGAAYLAGHIRFRLSNSSVTSSVCVCRCSVSTGCQQCCLPGRPPTRCSFASDIVIAAASLHACRCAASTGCQRCCLPGRPPLAAAGRRGAHLRLGHCQQSCSLRTGVFCVLRDLIHQMIVTCAFECAVGLACILCSTMLCFACVAVGAGGRFCVM